MRKILPLVLSQSIHNKAHLCFYLTLVLELFLLPSFLLTWCLSAESFTLILLFFTLTFVTQQSPPSSSISLTYSISCLTISHQTRPPTCSSVQANPTHSPCDISVLHLGLGIPSLQGMPTQQKANLGAGLSAIMKDRHRIDY